MNKKLIERFEKFLTKPRTGIYEDDIIFLHMLLEAIRRA